MAMRHSCKPGFRRGCSHVSYVSGNERPSQGSNLRLIGSPVNGTEGAKRARHTPSVELPSTRSGLLRRFPGSVDMQPNVREGEAPDSAGLRGMRTGDGVLMEEACVWEHSSHDIATTQTGAPPALPVLVVDDDRECLLSYRLSLRLANVRNVLLCDDAQKVQGILKDTACSVMLLDLAMPNLNGEELLSYAGERYPEMPVVVITATNDVDTAVRCMRAGARDYLVKPIEESRLIGAVRNALELRELHCENASLRTNVPQGRVLNPEPFERVLTCSPLMRSLFAYVEAVAASPRPILITGESGTGKELLARAIHAASGRRGEFVPVNAAGLDDTLFSDTLFGHTPGAYTGAPGARAGLVERARGGTLLLDEVGSLGETAQLKLLRLLQEGDYYPLGSDAPRCAHIAVLACTNDELSAKVRAGEFRNDLYYRLNTHRVHIPALRERTCDIPLLIAHFAEDACRALRREPMQIDPAVCKMLQGYPFAGNVRELQSMVFDCVARAPDEVLTPELFAPLVRAGQALSNAQCDSPLERLLRGRIPLLDEMETFLIGEALKQAGGSQSAAAQILGVAQSTLSRHLARKASRPK